MATVTRPARTGLWLALVVGVVALPACNRSRPTVSDSSPTPPSEGSSKFGPPGGIPTNTNNGSRPPSGPKDAAPPAKKDPTLPSPPATPLIRLPDPRTRLNSQNNLKEIALAIFNFEAANGTYPAGIADKSGQPGLSWRVALLPFMGQEDLYKQFKLDEPWDSEHNRKLIGQMPRTYGISNLPTNGYTFYRSFSGAGAILPPQAQPGRPGQPIPGTQFQAITDGMSNTLMVAEAAEPVIWTKPDDLPFTPGKPPKLGGGVFADGFHGLFCDGRVRYLPANLDATTLSNLIQINDGNLINLP